METDLVADGNYNDTGSGYTSAGTATFSSNIGGYMKLPNGTNLAGFAPASTSYGSATTFFCDYASVSAELLGAFGGRWNYGDSAGVFLLNVYPSASYSYAAYGGRLMYLKTA